MATGDGDKKAKSGGGVPDPVWAKVAAETRPLKGRARKLLPPAPPLETRARPRRLEPSGPPGLPRQLGEGKLKIPEPNLSRRLRRGAVTPEAALDLHGMSREQAYAALLRFVQRHAAAGARCLRIVTGRGRPGKPAVMRQSLPHWLEAEPLRSLVSGAQPAAPEDGGDGAILLLIRKQR